MNIEKEFELPAPPIKGQVIVSDSSKEIVFLSSEAEAAKSAALAHSIVIVEVTSASNQQLAVSVQRELMGLLGQVEKARKECKQPVLDFGRAIDTKAKEFVDALVAEELRISKLIAEFQSLEMAKVRAAEQANNDRLTALEQEKAKELAKAKTHDEFDEIQARYNDLAAAATPPPAPPRANGQRIREEWVVEVINEWTLARAHPNCVKISPLLTEIKDLLDAGVKVAGVRAEKQVKASVTAGRTLKAIDV